MTVRPQDALDGAHACPYRRKPSADQEVVVGRAAIKVSKPIFQHMRIKVWKPNTRTQTAHGAYGHAHGHAQTTKQQHSVRGVATVCRATYSPLRAHGPSSPLCGVSSAIPYCKESDGG